MGKKAAGMGDYSARTVLVTGGNSGLGFEAARQLAEDAWGRVIIACRTEEKAQAARAKLVALTGKDPFGVLAVDTSEVASANTACDQLRARGDTIDFLLLNAGATGKKPQFNSDGVEITWASTLVGHHVMTMRMLKDGLLSARARIVISGSEGALGNVPGMKVYDIEKIANRHFGGNRATAIEAMARLRGPHRFRNMNEYVTAKLVVAWWAAALARRLPPGITVNAVSPGSAPSSRFTRNAPLWMSTLTLGAKVFGPLVGMAGPTSSAARRYLDAADLDDSETGSFYGTAHRRRLVGPTSIQTWPDYLTDHASQEAGFEAVVRLTGVRFPGVGPSAT